MSPTHHTCSDCGYVWPYRTDGSHSCVGRLTAQIAELSPTNNRYGVDAEYFQKKLHLVLRDFASFKPDELARALFRLGKVADEAVLAESEFAQAEQVANVVRQPRLIGWRTDNYLWETNDPAVAKNWEGNVGVLPIFEGDPNTKLQAPAAQSRQAPQAWREALEFYANGNHLLLADPDAWDTCSGEPINFLHDEAGTASVEDGSIAKQALGAAPKPVANGGGNDE
ncbi:hypothetical protein L5B98_05785 [Pseudomonas aeruginosa]|nr:hypothetical protein [Pseudomonas aeruginosa]MDG3747547.1 hypothetical protein [Pseudomonas aeruginosa]MDG3791615.1 hypothetical protein [Pseudomonas aeruginosa]MDG4305971.1 hypothetical protein [Pseudomonas aeruginosa]